MRFSPSPLRAGRLVNNGHTLQVELPEGGRLLRGERAYELLDYWAYEGSLTTPPCREIVDWMVARQPLEGAAAVIQRFTALYPMNARPVAPPNRRCILSSF